MLGNQADDAAAADRLDLVLDRVLPTTLPTRSVTEVFVVGTCFHRESRIDELSITVEGKAQPVTAHSIPRPDRFAALQAEATGLSQGSPARDPRGMSYLSGFWATVPVAAGDSPRTVKLRAEAQLRGGASASATLGTVEVVEPPVPEHQPAHPQAGLIAICMATFDSEPELFRVQIESIRAQTDTNWTCLISDDCSSPDRFQQIQALVAGDDRFRVSRSSRRLGFYRNFERALRMAPPEAEFVALSDHDDRWYPDKLASLREAISGAELAYSDARRVDEAGAVRAESLWEGRSNNHVNLASLVISNTIVGASCLLRSKVVKRALPFPETPGWDFHDHWIAVVALSLGDVAYVGRPLYDYVQHPTAVLGRGVSSGAANDRTRRLPPHPLAMLSRWRSAYFTLYLQRDLYARLLLVRCSQELTPRKRKALGRVISAVSSPLSFTWLAVRPVRALFGRNETLAAELPLIRGIAWRRLIGLRARSPRRPPGFPDELGVPSFDPRGLDSRQARWLTGR